MGDEMRTSSPAIGHATSGADGESMHSVSSTDFMKTATRTVMAVMIAVLAFSRVTASENNREPEVYVVESHSVTTEVGVRGIPVGTHIDRVVTQKGSESVVEISGNLVSIPTKKLGSKAKAAEAVMAEQKQAAEAARKREISEEFSRQFRAASELARTAVVAQYQAETTDALRKSNARRTMIAYAQRIEELKEQIRRSVEGGGNSGTRGGNRVKFGSSRDSYENRQRQAEIDALERKIAIEEKIAFSE